MEQGTADYATWSPDRLLNRIRNLEKQLETANGKLQALRESSETAPVKKSSLRPFNPSRYSTRLIALKFAYLGQNYNGFEHHNNNRTRMPAIEMELHKALVKGKFISPPSVDGGIESGNISWDGCDYSKCGRTDRGVSAFGQVIGIRVRSNRPLKREDPSQSSEVDSAADQSGTNDESVLEGDGALVDISGSVVEDENELAAIQPEFHDIDDELPYAQILNRLLPADIRVLAWCPAPEDFSARFSCRERRYRYFFTQPAFTPIPGTGGLQQGLTTNQAGERRRDGWLNIDAMKIAAKKYEGLHDFRNLCKVDASKQLDNFMRRITLSEIREVDSASEPAAYVAGKEFAEFDKDQSQSLNTLNPLGLAHSPRVYQFVLHGSAFLWHQVRHMVAILFLVGQGLENPSLVDELLDVTSNPGRPQYEMAEDAPLVLWDCIFPEEGSETRGDALPWNWVGDERLGKANGKFGHQGAVVDELWQLWRKRKMDEILAGSLLNLAVHAGGVQPPALQAGRRGEVSRLVYRGGPGPKSDGIYVPVMEKSRLEPVEVINARYRERRGIEPKRSSLVTEVKTDHE